MTWQLENKVPWMAWRNWGSSVSIVSGYRLDDCGLIPGRGKGCIL